MNLSLLKRRSTRSDGTALKASSFPFWTTWTSFPCLPSSSFSLLCFCLCLIQKKGFSGLGLRPKRHPTRKAQLKWGISCCLCVQGRQWCQLSTVNCQLSTVNCQLSTVNCQLSTVNCQLSTVNCQLSTVNTATIHEFVRVLVRTEIGLSIFRSVNRVLYLVSTNFVRI
jgi:hypothetical protein